MCGASSVAEESSCSWLQHVAPYGAQRVAAAWGGGKAIIKEPIALRSMAVVILMNQNIGVIIAISGDAASRLCHSIAGARPLHHVQ